METLIYVSLLWFNFILGSNFIFFCFKLIVIHYNTQKQKKTKSEPRMKLNHNIYLEVQQWDHKINNISTYPKFQQITYSATENRKNKQHSNRIGTYLLDMWEKIYFTYWFNQMQHR